MRRGERTGEGALDVLWPCFSIPSHLFWPLSKASLVAPWHGLTPRQTSSMLRGHLIWCLIHTALWHLQTRVSLCGHGVSPEGSERAARSHAGGRMPHICQHASSWRVWPHGCSPDTQNISRKFSGEKSVMRHISCSSVRVFGSRAFTAVTQACFTWLYRCWLSNGAWWKRKNRKLDAKLFQSVWYCTHRRNPSNYWKYAVLYSARACAFQMRLNGLDKKIMQKLILGNTFGSPWLELTSWQWR